MAACPLQAYLARYAWRVANRRDTQVVATSLSVQLRWTVRVCVLCMIHIQTANILLGLQLGQPSMRPASRRFCHGLSRNLLITKHYPKSCARLGACDLGHSKSSCDCWLLATLHAHHVIGGWRSSSARTLTCSSAPCLPHPVLRASPRDCILQLRRLCTAARFLVQRLHLRARPLDRLD